MDLIRIVSAKPLGGYRVELTLTTGEVIEISLNHLLRGPVFDATRSDLKQFQDLTVEAGAIIWPNGADLCPDAVIWGGLPPAGATSTAA